MLEENFHPDRWRYMKGTPDEPECHRKQYVENNPFKYDPHLDAAFNYNLKTFDICSVMLYPPSLLSWTVRKVSYR